MASRARSGIDAWNLMAVRMTTVTDIKMRCRLRLLAYGESGVYIVEESDQDDEPGVGEESRSL